MSRQILHIDFDSFFASCEQQYNPRLRGKPVGVTATNGRTCIIASSREAKRLGIKTGTRSFEAENIYPGIILVPADFVKYWEASKKFINICSDYSPFVEVFSIDELFMDAGVTSHLFGGVAGIIQKIKSRIKNEIGEYITASFGISHNKLLAKLASGLNKPNGFCSINQNDIERVYARAKLTDVCGIGNRVQVRLNKIGIRTLLDLRKSPIDLLVGEFGKVEGQFLKSIGLGIDDSPIVSYTQAPEVKSVGRNYCLPKNEYRLGVVLQNLYELCEEVGIKLRRLDKKAKTVSIYLRGNIDIGGQKTFGEYIDSGKDIFEACKTFFPDNFFSNSNDYIRQIGISASNLFDSRHLTSSLFASKEKNSLQKTIDKINEKFGDHTIRNGFLLYADKLTTVPNGYMADKFERTKLASEFS